MEIEDANYICGRGLLDLVFPLIQLSMWHQVVQEKSLGCNHPLSVRRQMVQGVNSISLQESANGKEMGTELLLDKMYELHLLSLLRGM